MCLSLCIATTYLQIQNSKIPDVIRHGGSPRLVQGRHPKNASASVSEDSSTVTLFRYNISPMK